MVDGAINWNSELTFELKGGKRILTGNRLPDHPTGKYPIDKSDDAYQYDHNPNSIKEKLFKLELPAHPVAASKASPVTPGAIGVMLTGSLIFNGLDAAGRDAVAHETQDGCLDIRRRAGNTTIIIYPLALMIRTQENTPNLWGMLLTLLALNDIQCYYSWIDLCFL